MGKNQKVNTEYARSMPLKKKRGSK